MMGRRICLSMFIGLRSQSWSLLLRALSYRMYNGYNPLYGSFENIFLYFSIYNYKNQCVCVCVCVWVGCVCGWGVCVGVRVCVCVCVCVGRCVCVCVCVCVCGWVCRWVCLYVFMFLNLLTFSMLHYKVILHVLQLNIHNTVTYISTYVQFLPFSIVTAGLLSVF